jgi:hypothetical protein
MLHFFSFQEKLYITTTQASGKQSQTAAKFEGYSKTEGSQNGNCFMSPFGRLKVG